MHHFDEHSAKLRMPSMPMPAFTQNFRPGKFFQKYKAHVESINSGQTQKRHLTAIEWTNIGHDSTTKDHSTKADQWHVDTKTIRRALSSSAYAIQLTQEIVLRNILKSLKDDPPQFVQAIPQWDETKQRMKFAIEGKSISQTADVYVSRLIIGYGWADGRPIHFIQLNLPPVPIPNTSWESLRIDPKKLHPPAGPRKYV